jgi:hypothetical protein
MVITHHDDGRRSQTLDVEGVARADEAAQRIFIISEVVLGCWIQNTLPLGINKP